MAPTKNDAYDLEVDEATSERMSRIRTENTKPEMAVRRIVHGMGYRYVTHNRDLPGSPDITNRARGWVIFVHGCYWHHHERCSKATVPKRNRDFWLKKFSRNRERDARVQEELREMDIEPIIVWQCELAEPELLAQRIDCELRFFY